MSRVSPGVQLQSRYTVLEPLGRGGLSQTFDVDDRGTIKVLKVLNLERFSLMEGKEKAIALFQREADVLSRLSCPGVPKVEPDGYFVLVESGQESIHCLVMEKIEGLNLEQWLEQQTQPIAQDLAIEWLRQLLSILDSIHQEGLIHRDIKPTNIMRRPDGQLVLIDFGGVREVTETYLRSTGTGLVSPGYTPPEQAEGKAVLQSDFFALGRTFVHLLTGKHPLDFERDPRSGRLQWETSASHIARSLVELVDYLMALLPSRRPQSAATVLRYLETIAAPTDTTARSPAKPAAVPRTAAPVRKPGLLRNLVAAFRPAAPVSAWQKAALRRTLIGHANVVSAIAVSSVSSVLASASHDQTVKLWSLRSKELIRTLMAHSDRVNSVVISPNGQWLASASHDKTVKLWWLETGELRYTLVGHRYNVLDVAFSPDSRTLLSASNRETRLWSTQTGNLLRPLCDYHVDPVRVATVSPAGVCILGCMSGNLECWDGQTGERLQSLATETGGVTSIAFSPDGQQLVCSVSRTLQLWNLAAGQRLRMLEVSADGSLSAAFSPDGQVIASGGDREVTLWSAATGQRLNTLVGHTGAVRSLAFSADGSVLISASQDRTIKLWMPIP